MQITLTRHPPAGQGGVVVSTPNRMEGSPSEDQETHVLGHRLSKNPSESGTRISRGISFTRESLGDEDRSTGV